MSDDRKTVQLFNAHQGNEQITALWKFCKPRLITGARFTVTAGPMTRSDQANRMLHASISEIAEQIEWAGKKHDLEVWKRLLVAAWLRARGEQLEILPAIDGHGVDIVFQRTSKLTRAECSELQEFVFAWGVNAGVKFTVPDEVPS